MPDRFLPERDDDRGDERFSGLPPTPLPPLETGSGDDGLVFPLALALGRLDECLTSLVLFPTCDVDERKLSSSAICRSNARIFSDCCFTSASSSDFRVSDSIARSSVCL